MRVQTLHRERIALAGEPNTLARVSSPGLERAKFAEAPVGGAKSRGEPGVGGGPRGERSGSPGRLLGSNALREPGAREPRVRGERCAVGEASGRHDRCGAPEAAARRDPPWASRPPSELKCHDLGIAGVRRGLLGRTHLTPKNESRNAVHGPAGGLTASPLSMTGLAAPSAVGVGSVPSVTTMTCSPFFTMPSCSRA